MRLSVLDQSPVAAGRAPAQSIRESLALVRHCEALGFHRYWVAEHHNSDSVAGSAPEVLMAALAATTTRIRIGSAGVMLPHYSALKVAEQFRLLEAIAPGRIDLGVGRAPGSDGLTAHALNPDAAQAAARFPAQVRDLLAWVGGKPLAERHPFATVRAQPEGPGAPEVWVLGSSEYGAQVAAHFGLPYCFAHFITDGHGAEEALSLCRDVYKPSARHPEPYAALCVWAFAAATEAEAERQYATRALWRLGRDRGDFRPMASPEDAAEYPYTEADRAHLARIRQRAIIGTGPQVAARLRDLGESVGASEIAVLSTAFDPDVRRASYAAMARAWGLGAPELAMAAE